MSTPHLTPALYCPWLRPALAGCPEPFSEIGSLSELWRSKLAGLSQPVGLSSSSPILLLLLKFASVSLNGTSATAFQPASCPLWVVSSGWVFHSHNDGDILPIWSSQEDTNFILILEWGHWSSEMKWLLWISYSWTNNHLQNLSSVPVYLCSGLQWVTLWWHVVLFKSLWIRGLENPTPPPPCKRKGLFLFLKTCGLNYP